MITVEADTLFLPLADAYGPDFFESSLKPSHHGSLSTSNTFPTIGSGLGPGGKGSLLGSWVVLRDTMPTTMVTSDNART